MDRIKIIRVPCYYRKEQGLYLPSRQGRNEDYDFKDFADILHKVCVAEKGMCGSYILGALQEGHTLSSEKDMLSRTGLALDFDGVRQEDFLSLLLDLKHENLAFAAHSTAKDALQRQKDGRRRFRLIVPCKEVEKEDFKHCTRAFFRHMHWDTQKMKKDMGFDEASLKVRQVMYFPTVFCTQDREEYFFDFHPSSFFSFDLEEEKKREQEQAKQMTVSHLVVKKPYSVPNTEEALAYKPLIKRYSENYTDILPYIQAFERQYTMQACMQMFLIPLGYYEAVGGENRYRRLPSVSSPGAVIINNMLFSSHSNTDVLAQAKHGWRPFDACALTMFCNDFTLSTPSVAKSRREFALYLKQHFIISQEQIDNERINILKKIY